MPRERKASVIWCGLFRFNCGPSPSSGSPPSGGGNCASSSRAFASRRSRTVFSSSFHLATSSLMPASSISDIAATAPNSIFETAPSSSASSRSEEHTSELQSRQYLVCRLLLEKKKTHSDIYAIERLL